MVNNNKRALGADYEQRAAMYLCDNGYVILDRNYRTKFGEIDIICKKDSTIVFVEVKYRSNNRFGSSIEAVDYKKQSVIRKTANMYLLTHYHRTDLPVRFDVIGFDKETINHIKNAF